MNSLNACCIIYQIYQGAKSRWQAIEAVFVIHPKAASRVSIGLEGEDVATPDDPQDGP
jgi:hypothetical protein